MLPLFKFNVIYTKTQFVVLSEFTLQSIGDNMYIVYTKNTCHKEILRQISEKLNINIFTNYFGYVTDSFAGVIVDENLTLQQVERKNVFKHVQMVKQKYMLRWQKTLNKKVNKRN